MSNAMRWGVIVWLATWACGNGPTPTVPTPEEDVAPPPADVTVPEVPPAPLEYEGEPGTLAVTASFNGENIASVVEVRRFGQQDVAAQATLGEADPQHGFSLPPGRYDVRATFPEAIDGAADVKANQRVQTGRTLRIDFTFEGVSAVTLECSRGGRSTAGNVRLRRPGATDWLPQVNCGREFVVSGGSYEAEITIGSGRGATIITVPDLQIVGGGRVRTPVMIDVGGRH